MAALWARSTKNPDWSTGPLTRPFAHSLAPLVHCSLCSAAPLRLLVHSLAHFAHCLARGKVNDWMAIFFCVSFVLAHSAFLLWPALDLPLTCLVSFIRSEWMRSTEILKEVVQCLIIHCFIVWLTFLMFKRNSLKGTVASASDWSRCSQFTSRSPINKPVWILNILLQFTQNSFSVA